MPRSVVFALLEVLMIVVVGAGIGWWIAPGAGLVAVGALGLGLLALAQKPGGS